MKSLRNIHVVAAVAASLSVVALFLMGCEIDSAENATRNPGIIVAGFYVGQGGGSIVPTTTGADVVNMNVMQNGDQLEAIDNNGIIFRGSLGQVIDTAASFTMVGRATSGQEATMSGNFDVSGTTSTMSGSWIEPTLVSTVFGTATVPEADQGTGTNDTGNGTADVSVSPTSANLPVGQQEQFTASGGTGSYSWNNPTSVGTRTLSGTGNSVATFTATTVGTATLTVTDSDGESQGVSITVTEFIQ